MSEFDMTDGVEPEEPARPEEYDANEREEVSAETGTVYDPTGEPEATPQDLETAGDTDPDEAPAAGGDTEA